MQPIAWGGYPNYVIQNGDKLFWRQWESSSARAGITLFFNPNAQTGTGWVAKDQDGQWINSDGDTDFWHYRRVDLSQFAGSSIYDICLVTDGDTGAGPWDVYYTDIAIVSADGTVRPLYNRQATGQSFSVWGTAGVTGRGYEVNFNPNAGTVPDVDTNYYHEDSLGSARMMTSVDGYPVWKGTYLPFGAEWNPQMTVGNYKFAGMEQDAESGLGHTQFRQYNSTLGRWLTPDPVGGDLMNPQSLNRYAYVLNNPTSLVDPLGLDASYCAPGVLCTTVTATPPDDGLFWGHSAVGCADGNWGGCGPSASINFWVPPPGWTPFTFPHHPPSIFSAILSGIKSVACSALDLNESSLFHDTSFLSPNQVNAFFQQLPSTAAKSWDGSYLADVFSSKGINPGVGVGIINAETSFKGNANDPFNSGGSNFYSSTDRGLAVVVKLESNAYNLAVPLSNLTNGANSLGEKYTTTTPTSQYNTNINFGFRKAAKSAGVCQ
ncbi:MAG: RHS repeat-associated core domain-containing protein [Terriglobia bacterium]